ncbi:hypothetical protein O0L34_g12990 [Tuta absoluta]|nr:hypothetical protein O0L34_g12990 [Tuta absoluta]
MDFTPELSAFQGVIISADNVHTFLRLTARGGNEDQIDYIIENMLRFLKQQNYITENGTIVPDKIERLRKFAFYIFLNSDLPALEQLVGNDGIDSVIWTVPTIPKCLMSEILWKLHMEQFVYEAIAYSCPQLSLELASALIDYIKYFSPAESVQKLKIIATALYKLICRLHFFSLENDVLTNLLTTAFNVLQKCLANYVEHPQASKLESLKKDALYKYKGLSLHTMFHLIYNCLEEFTGVQTFNPLNFSEIYQLTYKVGCYREDPLEFAICNSPNKSILECLEKCNEMLLDQCKVLVMDISVDVFCAWSEFEESGQSMQQTIGEFCYKLRTKLLNVNVICEHPVVSMIQHISRKPKNVQDEIDRADTETIVKNIQNEEKGSEWVRALIHKEKLLQDAQLIEVLETNIAILNEAESHCLYKKIQTYLNENFENLEKANSLAIKAFQRCAVDTKHELIDKHFKDNCFNDSMENSEFNAMLTEVFNKVISDPDADLSGILSVFIQNPQSVYTKIFNLSVESSQATDIMLRAMKLLEKYSNHYYSKDTEPCIVRIAETVLEGYLEKEVTQRNFIKFICGLKAANIIPGTKLLLLIIMPKLHKALLDKDVTRIHFQCKLLADAFTLDELMPYRAPMLAMIARVLEVVRWKITTFVVEAPSALELALVIQKRLFDTYGDEIPEKEETWLKSKLHKLQPLNCYYYRKLWNLLGRNFVEIVSGNFLDEDVVVQLSQPWLAQILCSTTQQEWCEIWDSISQLSEQQRINSLCQAMTVVTVTEAMNRSEANSWQCILQCYRHLVYIMRYKYFKEPLTDEQVTTAVEKISNFANLIEESHTEAALNVFLPLFVYIVTKKNDYTVDVSSLLSANLKNDVFKEAVSKIYSNGNT